MPPASVLPDTSDFTLDEALLRRRKAARARRLHAVQIPAVRAAGLVILCLMALLRDAQTAPLFPRPELLALIGDVLNLASIETGKLELHPGPVDVRQLAQDAVALMQLAAHHKPVSLLCEIDPRLPACLWAVATRLRQLLMNLLHNAVKFTDRGTVQLRVEVLDHGVAPAVPGSWHVQLAVHDAGIGIAPAQMHAIFEPFTQVDSSSTRRHGGSGLGLAIVRELTGLMGGALSAQSQPGAGSVFRVRLTLPRVMDDAAAPSPPEPAPAATLRAPLVEDDPVNQIVVVEMLKRLGCEVDVADNSDAGHRAAVRGAYDIVFMDCHMPVLDGHEATRRIRAHEQQHGPVQAPHVVIVALTADVLPGDRPHCLDCDMDAVLTKPVSTAQWSAVRRLWRSQRPASSA